MTYFKYPSPQSGVCHSTVLCPVPTEEVSATNIDVLFPWFVLCAELGCFSVYVKFYEGEQPGAGGSREDTTKQSSRNHCLFQQGSVEQSRLQPILMSSIWYNLKDRTFFFLLFWVIYFCQFYPCYCTILNDYMYNESQNLLLDLVKDAWMLTAALMFYTPSVDGTHM